MAEIHQRRWRTATKWLDTALENQIARRSIIGRKLAVRRAARGRWNWGGRICGSRAGGGLCTASARSRIRLGWWLPVPGWRALRLARRLLDSPAVCPRLLGRAALLRPSVLPRLLAPIVPATQPQW